MGKKKIELGELTVEKYEEKTTDDGSEVKTVHKAILEGHSYKVTIVSELELCRELGLCPGKDFIISLINPQSTIDAFEKKEEKEEKAGEESFQEHIDEVKEKGDTKSPLLISAEAFNDTYDTLGGLVDDVVVEKNAKDKFLYAHAYSSISPDIDDPDSLIEEFCEQLKEFSAGIRWIHIDTNLFNANQGDLNKEEPVEELLVPDPPFKCEDCGAEIPPHLPMQGTHDNGTVIPLCRPCYETRKKGKAEGTEKRAIFIKTTRVQGKEKERWECPECQKRWNRDPKKKGSDTKCSGCGAMLLLVPEVE